MHSFVLFGLTGLLAVATAQQDIAPNPPYNAKSIECSAYACDTAGCPSAQRMVIDALLSYNKGPEMTLDFSDISNGTKETSGDCTLVFYPKQTSAYTFTTLGQVEQGFDDIMSHCAGKCGSNQLVWGAWNVTGAH